MSLTLSHLIELVGNDNVRFQMLSETLTNATTRKGGMTALTFLTAETNPTQIMNATEPLCFIVWIPRELVKKAQAAYEQEQKG